jgi:FKBP-type peptidyl-prolyl cis-trans isomerase 2
MMDRIQTGSKADLIFNLGWKSENARHMDCYHARDVNFWRDILPAALKTELNHIRTGEQFDLHSAPGETIPEFNQRKLIKVKERQFERCPDPGIRIEPKNGRFYPKGFLRDVAGIFKVNREPFRCVNLDGDYLDADLNHPLASRDLDLSVIVSNVTGKSAERGGRCIDWMETIAAGTGMQARWQDKQTDFFSDRPFRRDDEEADALFYAGPRFSQHLDDTAIEVVRNIYGRLLKDGMRVLDLMSSWKTYIPGSLKPRELVGLGMNAKELQQGDKYFPQFRMSDPVFAVWGQKSDRSTEY